MTAPKDRPTAQLTHGPVGRTLFRLTLPMVWGLLAVMLFNIVDTFFIGQLGALPLAAVGFTFPVVFVVTGTAMGVGVGMSSVVARAIGEGNRQRVTRLTTDGLALALFLVLAFVLLGLVTLNPLFGVLGADDASLPLIRRYMIPWYLGVGFLVIPMVGNSAIRATGDTKTPSVIMMIAGGVNAVLDPLLIFGLGPFPRLEIAGAAIATVISYVITFVAALYILGHREKMLSLARPRLAQLLASWRSILHVALPAIGTNLQVPLVGGLLTRIMAGFSSEAVAALGVAQRLESLAMAGSFALSTATAPFAGQNFAAGRFDRVRLATIFGARYCTLLSLTIWVLMVLFADPIARAFNDDDVIVGTVKLFIWMVPSSYVGLGIMLQIAATFNASGQPLRAALLFTSRMFIFTAPLALVGSYYAGIPGVFAAMFAGNMLSGVLATLLMRDRVQREARLEHAGQGHVHSHV